jgi:hypothetical protein
MILVYPSKTMLPTYQTTRYHNPLRYNIKCFDCFYLSLIYINKSKCMFVALLSVMFLGMYTINSLTP